MGKEDKREYVVAMHLASSLLETILAKEAKSRNVLWWKTPRLSIFGADRGLQYGLSGNRVLKLETLGLTDSMGTACAATAGSVK